MIDESPEPLEVEEPGESDCRKQALKYLSRREYSVQELSRKLRKKGYSGAQCDRVVEDLVAQRLVSDRRFAEEYLHAKIRKGLGPVRIRHALEEAGVDKDTIDDVMASADVEWTEQLRVQLIKKYGDTSPGTYKEWVKRARYLNNKGFSSEQIQAVLEFSS
ncbi:MAG: regulatory protein RecX [Proteobacteria bacterium]|nr:MAG: regulatory protein RecX [Pseudomonadota bacterium]